MVKILLITIIGIDFLKVHSTTTTKWLIITTKIGRITTEMSPITTQNHNNHYDFPLNRYWSNIWITIPVTADP